MQLDRRAFTGGAAALAMTNPVMSTAADKPESSSLFSHFSLSHVKVGAVSLRVRHGGSGQPLLLLHGYPETHMMWGKIADDLARDFTVIAPDLPGYGESTSPPTVSGHQTFSKRAMALDMLALMKHFGFDRFSVAGHDRGGRLAYRLALDHPAAVQRLCLLDIIPTGEVWERADARFALGYWHWGLLAQPFPLPERLIERDPEYFFFLSQARGGEPPFHPEAHADYVSCFRNPSTIHAMCEDYRAGADIDRALDDADKRAGRKIACPVLVLWGSRGAVGNWYDVMAVWRDWATDMTGQALDCGHFIPEEMPGETLVAFRQFFG